MQCPPRYAADCPPPPPECGEVVRAQIAPNRWFVLPAQAAINAGLDGPVVAINWDHAGEVLGIVGDAVGVGTEAARASLGLQIVVGGAPPVTAEINGGGEAPVLLSLLHGTDGPAPFRRRYASGETWYVMFHNYSGGALTPALALLVRADRP